MLFNAVGCFTEAPAGVFRTVENTVDAEGEGERAAGMHHAGMREGGGEVCGWEDANAVFVLSGENGPFDGNGL